jgi:hypothetical protein
MPNQSSLCGGTAGSALPSRWGLCGSGDIPYRYFATRSMGLLPQTAQNHAFNEEDSQLGEKTSTKR